MNTNLPAPGPILKTAAFNQIFQPVNEFTGRYRVLKGSAGSGKSMNLAQDYILKLSDPKFQGANLLVVRKVDETNRDSTFAELQGAIRRIFGSQASTLWKCSPRPMMMENRATGNRILFRGMKDAAQREKIKSVSFRQGKLTWIWLEEATEFLAEDFDVLDDRLRGELKEINPNLFYQITLSFNPVSSAHWIKKRFFESREEDILAHHSTYRENLFIDSAYFRRMERRKKQDPEGYRVYGLGEWGELGGLILSRIETHRFDTSPESFDAYYYGQDFGFNHANALLGVGIRDGELYVCKELVCYEKDTGEIIQMAEQAGVSKQIEMFCDSAEPDRIKSWRKAGFRAAPVKKEPGSVRAQIDFLRSRNLHLHPSCTHTQKEISQWKWKKDPASGLYLDEPVECFDDAIAALRYSIERLRRGASVQIMK